MIRGALKFIKQQLDQYIALNFGLQESAVVINALLDLDGAASEKNKNKVVITMINLDLETSRQFATMNRRLSNRDIAQVNAAQHFNVDLLFTSNFDDYEEALKFLGATISFFQANTSFNAEHMSSMPSGLTRLNFEIENASYLDTHNLWSAMGAKYQPSIIYKVRHISIDSDQINSVQPSITKVVANAGQ